MRHMTREEIIEFIKHYTWGTLIGVEPDGRPYAVELSYGFDGACYPLRLPARRQNGPLHTQQPEGRLQNLRIRPQLFALYGGHR